MENKEKIWTEEMVEKAFEEAIRTMQKLPTAKQMGSLGMKSGGLAAGHKTADGVAKKGKTKGKAVKMSMGGKC